MSLARPDPVFAFLSPAPLTRSPPRACIVRRPRHAPHHACRCRTARPRVRCVAGDGPPDEDSTPGATESDKNAWFPSLQVWFRRPHDRSRMKDDSPPANEQRDEKTSVAPRLRSLVEEVENEVQEATRRVQFRWPWQKEADGERNGISPASRGGVQKEVQQASVVKKVSHSDSKPGASFASVSKNGKVEPKGGTVPKNVSWPERWELLIRVIAPNLKREEADASAVKNEVSSSAKTNGSPSGSKENNNSAPVRTSSVSELYSPPGDDSESKDQKSSQERKPKWPKMPWSRDMVRQKSEIESSEEEHVTIVSEESPRTGPRISKISVVKKGSEKTLTVKPSDGSSPSETLASPERHMDSETTVLDVVDFSDSRETKQDEKERSSAEVKQGDREQEPAVPLSSASGTQLSINPMDTVSIPQRDVAAIRLIFGSETFFATETLSPPGGLIFRGNLRGEPKTTLAKLEERLATRLGDKYTLCLAQGEEDLRPVVVVVPTARDRRPATPRQRVLALVIGLFTVTTCLTRGLYAAVYKPIILAFYPMTGVPAWKKVLMAPSGIAMITSIAIGLVILASQIAQRVVASHHGTRIALPYFIPSVQLGSFGAVVQLASPTPSRAALFDIALAGAATLVVISMSFLLIGLKMSTIFPSVVPVPMSTVSSSVVIGFLTQHVPQGQILVDYGRSLIGLHPLAVIGANCLTIAALNLLPIRQLDGGRIISALYGRRTAVVASRITVLFLLLASTKSPYFVVFLAAVTFGPWSLDRPAKNELTEPNGIRTIIGYLFMLLMIGVLLPFPASRFFGTL